MGEGVILSLMHVLDHTGKGVGYLSACLLCQLPNHGLVVGNQISLVSELLLLSKAVGKLSELALFKWEVFNRLWPRELNHIRNTVKCKEQLLK